MDEGVAPVVLVLGIVAAVLCVGFLLSNLNGLGSDSGGLGEVNASFRASWVDQDSRQGEEWFSLRLNNATRNLSRSDVEFGVVFPDGSKGVPEVCGTYEWDGGCVERVGWPWSIGEAVAFPCLEEGRHRFLVAVGGSDPVGFRMECGGVVSGG